MKKERTGGVSTWRWTGGRCPPGGGQGGGPPGGGQGGVHLGVKTFYIGEKSAKKIEQIDFFPTIMIAHANLFIIRKKNDLLEKKYIFSAFWVDFRPILDFLGILAKK